MATVSVIGAGYVGLVTGTCLAELGHRVVGLEVNEQRVAALNRGELPIYEPDLGDLFAKHFRSGRLLFTADYSVAIPHSDFVFLAVNTPSKDDGGAETGFVLSALRRTLEHAQPGLTIVTKSTVPVGTGDELAEMVVEAGTPGIEMASNPEFLREGFAVADFLRPDRIVIGVEDGLTGERVARLFEGIDAPIIICSRRSAELAKYASNALLATRISFMNEIAGISAEAGADVQEISRIVGADRRIGPAFLDAGLGWGGSCFPKDVRALLATAKEHGRSGAILHAVLDVNFRLREAAFAHLRDAVAKQHDATVGVLGLAFKPDTDDVREAPALDIIGRLIEEGIHVRAHDPIAMPNAQRSLPNIRYCADAYEVAEGSHALLLATEWPEYLSLDWRAMRVRMRGDAILDGRNVLDRDRLSTLGFECRSVADRPDAGATGRSRQRRPVAQTFSEVRTRS